MVQVNFPSQATNEGATTEPSNNVQTLVLRELFGHITCAVYTTEGPIVDANQPLIVYAVQSDDDSLMAIDQCSREAVSALSKARQLLTQGTPERQTPQVATPAAIAGTEFVASHSWMGKNYGIYTLEGALTDDRNQVLVAYKLSPSGTPSHIPQGSPAAIAVLAHVRQMLRIPEHNDPPGNVVLEAMVAIAQKPITGHSAGPRRPLHAARARGRYPSH